MVAIALTIAGSDSGGGAGIQADLKAFSALGVYGASAITAVTAQNTQAVTAVQPVDLTVVTAQVAAVLSDLDVQAIKIGMLGTAPTIKAVTTALDGFTGPIVVDPVMVAKSGDALLSEDAVETLRDVLLPRATVLTPNLPEAARLLGTVGAQGDAEMAEQGAALLSFGADAVVMKGGHGVGAECVDLLITPQGIAARAVAARRATQNTHGTGCTLSSAIAAELAKGAALEEAFVAAHSYLQGAIAAADGLSVGRGHGPVHHFHALWRAV